MYDRLKVLFKIGLMGVLMAPGFAVGQDEILSSGLTDKLVLATLVVNACSLAATGDPSDVCYAAGACLVMTAKTCLDAASDREDSYLLKRLSFVCNVVGLTAFTISLKGWL